MYESILKLAQAFEEAAKSDPAVSGPNVVIQPMEPIIDRAVKILKRMDSNFFSGVRTINVTPGTSNLGFVESGENKDPAIININMGKIKSLTAGMNPEEAVVQTALTIAHERGHIKSYSTEQGFVGGENPAEAAEAQTANWINQNLASIKDLLVI